MSRTSPRHYRPRAWTEERRDQLAHYWCLEGWDFEQIADVLDSTPAAVHGQIAMLGLKLTPQAVLARRARGIWRGKGATGRPRKEMPTNT